jgi:hypothetical protein
MKMTYRATFKSMAGLVVVLLFMAFLFIGVGIQVHEIFLIVIGLFLVTLLLALRFRLKVVLAEREIAVTGLFKTVSARFDEITDARWMTEHDYPKSRVHGPFVYEIRTPDKTLRINFKFFPLDCMHNVLKRIEEVTERPNSQRTSTRRLMGKHSCLHRI